jgi:hypothetical protein
LFYIAFNDAFIMYILLCLLYNPVIC